MSSTPLSTQFIQESWQSREFTEIVQINIMNIIQFLNDFDTTVRGRLGKLNEKLNQLERTLEYCEASIQVSLQEPED